MNVAQLVSRLSAAPPRVLIYERLLQGQIVHAVRDELDEPRSEVFVMSSGTWSSIERRATHISLYAVDRWQVLRVQDAGAIIMDLRGETLILPLPTPITAVLAAALEAGNVPPTTQQREWRIELR